MAEPLGVAFIEIEPVAPGFRAKTEAQVRAQLAGVSAGVPPSPQTAAATAQVDRLTASLTRATTAEELLATATAQLATNEQRLALVTTEEARARLRAQLAAEADATAKRALLAVTTSTNAATVREIELLNAKTAAEVGAARATQGHAAAAASARNAILAESAAMTGLRGSALGVSPAFLAASVAAAGFFGGAFLAAEFDHQLNLIQEATQATGDEMDDTRRIAIQFGRDLEIPLTSAQEAAEAINLLARSGFDLQDSLNATRGVLLLNAAGEQTLAESVEVTDQVLDAFNLTAGESIRVADQLAAGSRFTQGSITEFAGALATVAPIADSMGLSLEDANTLLIQLAESGLSTSAGASALRTSLLRLADIDPKPLARVGFDVRELRDELGNLRPDAFVILGEALADLSQEQRNQVLVETFSRRSAAAVIRLVEQERAGYLRAAEAVREQNIAQRQAEARASGFKGALKETKEEAQDFGRTLGDVTQGPAEDFVSALGDLFAGASLGIEAVAGLASEVKNLGEELDDVTGTERVSEVGFDILGISGADVIGAVVDRFRGGERDVAAAAGRVSDEIRDKIALIDAQLDAGVRRIQSGTTVGEAVAQNLTTRLAVAQATGTEDDELRILRQQREAALERLRRNQRRLAAGDPRITQAAVQRAANEVTAAESAIDAILDGRRAEREAAADRQQQAAEEEKRNAERRADELERAADARDDAFIRGIQRVLDRKEEAVSVAASTEGLRDDIRTNVSLRNFLVGSIGRVRERIQDVRAAGRTAEALVDSLRDLRRARRDVTREIRALQQEQRQQVADTQVEQAELDLQILEVRIGDDPNTRQEDLLAAAHQRVINALLKAQRLTRKRSVEWKQLQLRIEQEKAAIRALREASKPDDEGDGRTFQQQAFEFLQAQQGFSSNLAGNLIPTTAAAGLVAGGSTPTGPTRVSSPFTRTTATEASRVRGVTAGQGDATIMLLREILTEIKRGNRSSEHPEARAQRRTGSAVGDYGGGGGAVGM